MNLLLGAARAINIQGWIGIALTVILGTLLAVQTVKTNRAHASAVKWEQSYKAEHTAHLQTETNYRRAAEVARQADIANAARVKDEQAALNERTTKQYETRIADARARAERLRHDAQARPNSSGSGTAGVSRPGNTPGEAHGAPPQGGLSLADRLIATEQAIQLDELITWVAAQSEVDFSK